MTPGQPRKVGVILVGRSFHWELDVLVLSSDTRLFKV